MKCYFLRHGIAAERGEWEGSDFDRPLTDEGHARMAREAKAIAKFDLGIELILTSPLVRAKETAEIVAKALKLQERLVVDERLGLAFDRIRLEGMLREHRGAKALLLVGHEPGMSRTSGERSQEGRSCSGRPPGRRRIEGRALVARPSEDPRRGLLTHHRGGVLAWRGADEGTISAWFK